MRDPVGGGVSVEALVLMDEAARERIGSRRVIRGGSWGGAAVNVRVAYRDSHPPDGAGEHVCFRCALGR